MLFPLLQKVAIASAGIKWLYDVNYWCVICKKLVKMSDDDIMKVFNISHKSQNQISEDFQNLQNCGCILVI